MFSEKKGFTYLPHTADVKFKSTGKNLEEAFVNAAFATFNVIVDTDKVESRLSKSITIDAKRELSLLYDFLDELLFFLDTEGFLLAEVKDLKIEKSATGLKLTTEIIGDTYTDRNNYDVQGNVKSVTYNDMNIEHKEDRVELTVVLDL